MKKKNTIVKAQIKKIIAEELKSNPRLKKRIAESVKKRQALHESAFIDLFNQLAETLQTIAPQVYSAMEQAAYDSNVKGDVNQHIGQQIIGILTGASVLPGTLAYAYADKIKAAFKSKLGAIGSMFKKKVASEDSNNSINEEMYDFVRDIKSALGGGNRVSDVEEYLGRELSSEEIKALKSAGVIRS